MESGVHSRSGWGGFHPYDPLWDGQNCTSSSTCCSFNNPPYFTKQLPNPTTDDLEVRLCLYGGSGDDAPIEFIELYVGLDEQVLYQNVLINTQQLTDMISSKMELINVSMREEFRAVERQFQEHKNQTTSELSDLHTSLQSTHTDHLTQICDKVDILNSRIINVSSATIDSKLDLLDSKQDELDMKVMSINSELEHNILTNITKQLQSTSESSHEALGLCGGKGWRRVAYLDMTDPNTTCPSGWQLGTRGSKRTCDKFSTGRLTCDSVFFPVSGGAYTTVCGRIRAYQFGPTDAFESYHNEQATTIDEPYVSGVSLTHGSPRQHIWTFAAGVTEAYHTREDACPCDDTVTISIPPFVGDDYFCESGTNSGSSGGFHPYDPLWDGQNCTSTSTCCSFNNPPYFTKQLPSPTTDDLEVRLCLYDSGEDAPIEFIELYVGLDERALYQNVLINTIKLTHMISSKMELINVSVREEFRAVERQFQEHMSVNSQLEQNILTNITKQLKKSHEELGSCGDEGWRRVAYLDMTNHNTTCPSGWQLTGHSKITCGKVSTRDLTCDSVFFPVSGRAYTRVCGRVRAYQNRPTDAFEAYHDGEATTIDEPYVSGVSLTHGSPRQHIWTFAAGNSEAVPTRDDSCPCDATISISVPPFVGEDYFCESGANSGSSHRFYPDDPLWDGADCTSSSTCCSFNNPPYFTKHLPNPTTDNIEVRLCWWETSDDTPVEFMELYVK